MPPSPPVSETSASETSTSESSTPETPLPEAGGKPGRRAGFLAGCRPATRRIHAPILDLADSRGHLNPRGLGRARAFSDLGSLGQSSVGFETLADYAAADEAGRAPYGGAEYGIVQSPEADAVGRKFAALHGGAGAVVCASGLAAIATVLDAFAPKLVLIPDGIYFPAWRYMSETGRAELLTYPAGASGAEVGALIREAGRRAAPADTMLYLEAPGSGTFEIPDIAGIVEAAARAGLRTVMDNTWASHVRFRPLDHGIAIAIQATTKHEGGYGDTPSGIAVARHEPDLARLRRQLRISGHGAVSPQTCTRLFHRVDGTQARLDRHAASAATLMQWFEGQAFATDILSPARPASPWHARFTQYFGAGNGLFTVVFDEALPAERVHAFVDALLLFRVAESWGGHVSLVLPVHPRRDPALLPKGAMFRFHAGLEEADDLVADLAQAARAAF
ncbi:MULTISPECIES: PLP-dependent transferase [Methylobacterium]|uniref:PLP-dependent transferase n=1 Tax=Methylobacterium TaxID=407 RepID=UPI0008E39CCE|nr:MULTISPECIES: PLP-dependent transferase [Methylobacterium]MBZ6412748.1 PLP-dependent transferase [Methylobacterium sp.]MBK3399991.1 PLP-dependent transferase [Methylobacterium ajmalii]MBK3411128.1 PLP-dependent transferase [Methylobacterium ajmalii]MBK3424931.1 PLP-dependent transferase [Methylobacterium ajmalii]SFF26881.1 cystathionine beta-lyase [Methylobacterium sp. yr596]